MTAIKQQAAQHHSALWYLARGLIVTGGLVLSVASARADTTLAEVTECMRANLPETVRIQQVRLNTVDRDGTQRLLTGRIVASRADGRLNANLRLESPPDLKDAAYLSRENRDGRDEIFLYVPAMNRVRRVAGGGQSSALFGTDFSYEDMRQVHDAFSGDQVTLLGKTELADRPAHHLEVLRSTEAGGVERMQAWVDQSACVVLQLDRFVGEQVVKRISSPVDSLKQLPGGQWYAEKVRVEDRLGGSSTEMTVEKVQVGTDMPERLFNPRSFYLGH